MRRLAAAATAAECGCNVGGLVNAWRQALVDELAAYRLATLEVLVCKGRGPHTCTRGVRAADAEGDALPDCMELDVVVAHLHQPEVVAIGE